MSDIDTKARRVVEDESPAAARLPEPRPAPRAAPRRRFRIFPLLITLAVIAVAIVLGRAMWDAYMGAPWTRDGTVRAYVVTMAPEVAGRIVSQTGAVVLPPYDHPWIIAGQGTAALELLKSAQANQTPSARSCAMRAPSA